MRIGSPGGVRPVERHLHLFDDKTGEALKTAFRPPSDQPEMIHSAHVKTGRN
jgi:hypothetical protein